MEFIHFAHHRKCRKSYHLMVYSLSVKELAIYHVVTIELYYNFVYSGKRNVMSKDFHFQSVISRPDNLSVPLDGCSWDTKPKSILTIMKAMGNHKQSLDRYKKVVVVDDQLDKVWNTKVPVFLNSKDISFHWVTPLSCRMRVKTQGRLFVNGSMINQIQEQRLKDGMFGRLRWSRSDIFRHRKIYII